jgi:N-acetylglutamate synthase-like GNAT family acetyltransferase
MSKKKTTSNEGNVRPSIYVRMIRHAESRNNQVYRDARFLFRGGTPEYDEEGWLNYVNQYRRADPDLSDTGAVQRDRLADFLVPHLLNQASHPVRVIVSPMRRTLETIRPTLERLHAATTPGDTAGGANKSKSHVIVNGFYHESEGCHTHEIPEDGFKPSEIRELMKDCVGEDDNDIEFEGFPHPDRGWYVNAKGPENREQSEVRASKFYLWLCEHLDRQLEANDEDVFDAGVSVPEEKDEQEHDKFGRRFRRRRMALLVGHADFMSLILKRIISGFGHFVENKNVSHRSAFVHANTGFTELEYFGKGRFLLMASNQTPHFPPEEYYSLRGGDSLKDGWSYVMPSDDHLLDSEVSVAYADEQLDDHVKDQTEALKSLYLPSKTDDTAGTSTLAVEEQVENGRKEVQFFVKQGLQVVGCASYNEESGKISDMALRPSARSADVGGSLIDAVRSHARKLGRSGSLLVNTKTEANKRFLEELGFSEVDEDDDHHEIEL